MASGAGSKGFLFEKEEDEKRNLARRAVSWVEESRPVERGRLNEGKEAGRSGGRAE